MYQINETVQHYHDHIAFAFSFHIQSSRPNIIFESFCFLVPSIFLYDVASALFIVIPCYINKEIDPTLRISTKLFVPNCTKQKLLIGYTVNAHTRADLHHDSIRANLICDDNTFLYGPLSSVRLSVLFINLQISAYRPSDSSMN